MKKTQAETTSKGQPTQPKSKDGITSSEQQERFLPIVTRTDIAIKRTALLCALEARSAGETRFRLDGLINNLSNNIPKWIIDYKAYVHGARVNADISFSQLYNKPLLAFERLKRTKGAKQALAGVETPKDLMELMGKKPNILEYAKRQRYNKVHGQPNCEAYAQRLKETIDKFALQDPSAISEGKRPMSAFTRAELDLRHEEQMAKLDKLVAHGYRLCWLSSHDDCSPRCAPWQGKLVDIVHKSDLPSKRMPYKKDGYVVYSLKSIMEDTDKYGYHNTIINGFNCRHHLIPYAKGSKPPRRVSEAERKKEYGVSQRLRDYERKIRGLKRKALLYNDFDKKRSKAFAKEANGLIAEYKGYAEGHGFKWHRYRVEV